MLGACDRSQFIDVYISWESVGVAVFVPSAGFNAGVSGKLFGGLGTRLCQLSRVISWPCRAIFLFPATSNNYGSRLHFFSKFLRL